MARPEVPHPSSAAQELPCLPPCFPGLEEPPAQRFQVPHGLGRWVGTEAAPPPGSGHLTLLATRSWQGAADPLADSNTLRFFQLPSVFLSKSLIFQANR